MRNVSIFILMILTTALVGCRDVTNDSRVKWGVHNSARSANLLNLRPAQSVEICADNKDHIPAAHFAIEQWATALGRWGHFKVLDCGKGATLRINMDGFEQTGLNFFTGNPGRVFVNGSASGNYLKAISLHEFGHSYGLCDQYKDAGSANCSDERSLRQDNDEVMGSTNAKKLALTAGDIEGVRHTAGDFTIKANLEWDNYLKNLQGTTPDQTGGAVFVRLVDTQSADAPQLAISVAQGSTPRVCLDKAGVTTCEAGSATEIPLRKDSSISGRDIFVSLSPVSNLGASARTVFMTNVQSGTGSKVSKFAITKR
jgi:hypothetical protein